MPTLSDIGTLLASAKARRAALVAQKKAQPNNSAIDKALAALDSEVAKMSRPATIGSRTPSALFREAPVPPEERDTAIDQMAAGETRTMPPAVPPPDPEQPLPTSSEENMTAGQPASGGISAPEREGGGYKASVDESAPKVLDALHDPTPLNPAAPNDDIIKRLTAAILAPQGATPGRRPLTRGEHIALGIMAGLDQSPDRHIFRNVVMPLLEAERNAPVEEGKANEEHRQHQIAALTALAQLQQQQTAQQATEAERKTQHEEYLATQKRLEGESAERRQEFQTTNERLNRALQQTADLRKEAMQAQLEKVPPMVQQNHIALLNALSGAQEASELIKQETGVLGGVPGGPVAGRMPYMAPGGETRAHLERLLAPINDAILKFYQRRGLSGEALLKIDAALPDIRMAGPKLVESVKGAIATLGTLVKDNETTYPSLKHLRDGEDSFAGATAVPNPALAPGDVDMQLEVPDEAR